MPITNWSQRLRMTVDRQAKIYVSTLPQDSSYRSLGDSTQLFLRDDAGTQHGNFCDASYAAILANAEWKIRLDKPHQRKNSLPLPYGNNACELDSANSSDALLMNIFCYPNILASELGTLLEVNTAAQPQFGFKAEVDLVNGRTDRTEVDLKIDNLLIEAKFTEKDFTQQTTLKLQKYSNLNTVFDVPSLPRTSTDDFQSYQLIRNVLAAYQHDCRFILLCDARRPDLIRAWCEIYAAIKSPSLRARCNFVLWQQIAYVVPAPLATYLDQSRSIA